MRKFYSIEDKETIQKENTKDFNKMYQNSSIEGKYILWLNLNFYFKCALEEIVGNLEITLKDGSILDLPKLKIRNPYPNKNYHSICMKNGNKVSDFIILPFETFEELSQISSICYMWDTGDYCAIYNYQLNFEFKEGLLNYQLTCRDLMIYLTEDSQISSTFPSNQDTVLNYLEEFDDIVILNTNKKNLKIKGNPNNIKISDSFNNENRRAKEKCSIFQRIENLSPNTYFSPIF